MRRSRLAESVLIPLNQRSFRGPAEGFLPVRVLSCRWERGLPVENRAIHNLPVPVVYAADRQGAGDPRFVDVPRTPSPTFPRGFSDLPWARVSRECRVTNKPRPLAAGSSLSCAVSNKKEQRRRQPNVGPGGRRQITECNEWRKIGMTLGDNSASASVAPTNGCGAGSITPFTRMMIEHEWQPIELIAGKLVQQRQLSYQQVVAIIAS
jgi:hypothetical protein